MNLVILLKYMGLRKYLNKCLLSSLFVVCFLFPGLAYNAEIQRVSKANYYTYNYLNCDDRANFKSELDYMMFCSQEINKKSQEKLKEFRRGVEGLHLKKDKVKIVSILLLDSSFLAIVLFFGLILRWIRIKTNLTNWPLIHAKIESADLYVRRFRGIPSYFLLVSVAYKIFGREYSNKIIAERDFRKRKVEQRMNNFNTGSEIEIIYNPEKPRQSYIKNMPAFRKINLIILFYLFVLVSVITLILRVWVGTPWLLESWEDIWILFK